ncbi:MAG: nucleotidyltransferase domain-containing protein [Anaerolineae bacterium]|nr:nucleotidyltransferase domain-containing protein [Anaerolineae bacterium]MDW7991299.1 nucleotidyltransferase domain-containing protein [Anaerolineae bacterium]
MAVVGVFGSYVRGEAQPESDLDLLGGLSPARQPAGTGGGGTVSERSPGHQSGPGTPPKPAARVAQRHFEPGSSGLKEAGCEFLESISEKC